MLKAILWDNDGVLVDTEKYYFKATKELFKKYGAELTKEDYFEYYLKQNTGAWHLLGDLVVDENKLKELRAERGSIYLKYLMNGDHSVTGAEKVLTTLYGKYRMAIVTSSRKDHFEAIHSKTNFLNFIEFSLTREDYKKSKPDPEPYLKALDKLNVKPDEALVIEDSERGLTAAKKAGIKCWIIPSSFAGKNLFASADRILQNISEVLNHI